MDDKHGQAALLHQMAQCSGNLDRRDRPHRVRKVLAKGGEGPAPRDEAACQAHHAFVPDSQYLA